VECAHCPHGSRTRRSGAIPAAASQFQFRARPAISNDGRQREPQLAITQDGSPATGASIARLPLLGGLDVGIQHRVLHRLPGGQLSTADSLGSALSLGRPSPSISEDPFGALHAHGDVMGIATSAAPHVSIASALNLWGPIAVTKCRSLANRGASGADHHRGRAEESDAGRFGR